MNNGKKKKIGILTGGGDCPGLNAVIRAASVCANINGYSVIGFRDGFEGLLKLDYMELNIADVSGIINVGGTILGATNTGHFNLPLSEEIINQCVSNYLSLELECIICIGGEGSMSIAHALSHYMNFIGVPKTIDNDLSNTDQTFGYDSAVSIVTESLDRLHTTTSSHHRVMVVEVMGRNAGWVALASGISGGAHIILIPEIEWNWTSLFNCIKKRHLQNRTYTIIVVAEGIRIPLDKKSEHEMEKLGVGNIIANAIKEKLKIETRCTVLGHVQRGGTPTSFDRILATNFGAKAAQLACSGIYGVMVCLKGTKIETIDFSEDMRNQKFVDKDDQLVKTANLIGICFGDK